MNIKLILLIIILIILSGGAVWYFNPGGILGQYGNNPPIVATTTSATSTLVGNTAPVSIGEGIMAKGMYWEDEYTRGGVQFDSYSQCSSHKSVYKSTKFYLDYKNTTNELLELKVRLLYGAGYSGESNNIFYRVDKNNTVRINMGTGFGTNGICVKSGLIEIYNKKDNTLIAKTEIGN